MSNKGEERRERNLSDRKVPSIHLICRLGATWFQIWLRTETHTRTRIHTPFTRKQERKRPKEIQTHTNNVIDGKQQNTYTERKVYSHMCHSHTHTHCVWRSDFSKSSSCSSLPGARQGKNYDNVFSVSCLSKHTCKHTHCTHMARLTRVFPSMCMHRASPQRKTKSTSCTGSSLFYWTIPNKMITLNLQRSLSACFSHNPVRLSPVNDSMRA